MVKFKQKKKFSIMPFAFIFLFCCFNLIFATILLYPNKEIIAYAKWTDVVTNSDSPSEGAGTPSDPFKIRTAEQLAYIAKNPPNPTHCFQLQNNIDLSGNTWVPIGTEANKFKGVFDGQGFSISGLNIPKNDNQRFAGLFGCVYGGTIKNVVLSSLQKTQIIAYSTDTTFAGAIVAYMENNGRIENCFNINAEVYAISIDGGSLAGGIAGDFRQSSINNAYNYAHVISYSNSSYAGGIIGRVLSLSSVTLTLNKGNVTAYPRSDSSIWAGGIVGKSEASISTSQNYGNVSSGCASTTTVKIPADVGDNYSVVGNGGSSTSFSYSGGIVGKSSAAISYCSNEGNVNAYSKTTTSTPYFSSYTHSSTGPELVWGWWGGVYFEKEHITVYNYDVTGSYGTSQTHTTIRAYAGGIAGYTTLTISNCYNLGKISGGYKRYSQYVNFSIKDSLQHFLVIGAWYDYYYLVFRANMNYCYETYYSAINGNRSATINNCYGNYSYYKLDRSLEITAYNAGSGTTSGSSSSSGWLDLSPPVTSWDPTGGSEGNLISGLSYEFYMTSDTVYLKITGTIKHIQHALDLGLVEENDESFTKYNLYSTINQPCNYSVNSSPSAAALGGTHWIGHPMINGGKPAIQGLYW